MPLKAACKALAMTASAYWDHRKAIASQLSVPLDPMSFQSLSVRFGCTHNTPSLCQRLQSHFTQSYSLPAAQKARFLRDTEPIIIACFFAVCKALRVRVSKDQKEECGATTKLAVKYTQWIDANCKDVLAELVASLNTPSDSRRNRVAKKSVATPTADEIPSNNKKIVKVKTSSPLKKCLSKPLTGINILIKDIDVKKTQRYSEFVKWMQSIINN